MPCKSSLKVLYNYRICLDFTVYCFYVILFRLFESLFGIFTFFDLANRPLFAAIKQCKSSQKQLSTKLEIKSKQILNRRQQKTARRQKCNCIGGQQGLQSSLLWLIYGQFTGIYAEKDVLVLKYTTGALMNREILKTRSRYPEGDSLFLYNACFFYQNSTLGAFCVPSSASK